jgi:hypothetical protein
MSATAGQRRSLRTASSATAAAVNLLEIQIELIDRLQDTDSWAHQPVVKLKTGVLGALTCVVAQLSALADGTLAGEGLENFRQDCAEGANFFAFLAERARRLAEIQGESDAPREGEEAAS